MNVDSVQTVALTSSSSDDAAWVGGYFAYGGAGAQASVVITFAIPPRKRLGRHTDTAEETQFILAGAGTLLLDDGPRPVRAGDVVVLPTGTFHDLHNPGDVDLRVIGFFAAPSVEQHWSSEVWEPGGLTVTGTPNR
ncbi:MAG: cupin domain-containing protein [Thermoleophilia bacterium]|nr:cupin domain-containing protein [Thermoleophilia bacterium]